MLIVEGHPFTKVALQCLNASSFTATFAHWAFFIPGSTFGGSKRMGPSLAGFS